MTKYICNFDSDLYCPNRLSDHIHCNDNIQCSFCVEETKAQERNPKGYVRKERWYEKYYK